jgi:hypothetical protein
VPASFYKILAKQSPFIIGYFKRGLGLALLFTAEILKPPGHAFHTSPVFCSAQISTVHGLTARDTKELLRAMEPWLEDKNSAQWVRSRFEEITGLKRRGDYA